MSRSRTVTNPPSRRQEARSSKSRLLALLLAIPLGYAGIHRFYAGKFWTGLLMFVTAGGFGIWWIFDVVMLILGRFRDAEGRIMGPPNVDHRKVEYKPDEEHGVRRRAAARTDAAPGRTRVDDEKGRDGTLEGDDQVRLQNDDLDNLGELGQVDGEVSLDDEELVSDPLEKEFEELEREMEQKS